MARKHLQHLKKIKAYSAYATAFIAAQQTAHADIKYVNVDPDYNITQGNHFELDLNNDAQTDFIFSIENGNYGSRQALVATDNPNNKVKALCQSSSWYGNNYFWCSGVGALDQGDTIGLSLDWTMNITSYWNSNNYDFFANLGNYKTNTGYYYYYYGTPSPWLGAQSKYLGVRFQAGSNVHYGWIRLDIDSKLNSITIKDYAYNTEPFASIISGEMGSTSNSSIQNPDLLKEIAVYSYGNKIKIIGNLQNKPSSAIVSVHNLMGQLVHQSQLQTSSTEIEINDVVGNYYVVSIQQQDAVITKKVFVKN